MLALAAATPAGLRAQSSTSYTITVEDSGGAALPGATVTDAAGNALGRTDASGNLDVPCAAACRISVSASGFALQTLSISGPATVRLQTAAAAQQITVTAYRAPLSELSSPVTTVALSQQTLRSTAAITLDSQLRQIPGVELFRRSSSLVANPTSQGISLRGLGSTSASRTLVTEDDVPLNDPEGGWIHWQETPELAIRDIQLVRGGASDLYGSSAIGGVINVIPVRPAENELELSSSYGGEDTFDENLMAETKYGPWGALLAGGAIGTDGYIQEAPPQRGPVDQPSNVHSQSALLDVEHERGPLRLFARGSGYNDSRHNGTPYQFNATKLARYALGGDWRNAREASLLLRLYGADERYRQTFSSISNLPSVANPACSYRCGENPSKFSFIPDNELGAALQWNQPFGAGLLLVAGADVHDARTWDREDTFSTGALTNLHDHQRDSGAYAEAMWVHGAWTLTASGRLDWFQNYDGQQLDWTGSAWTLAATQPPRLYQNLFDPRLGVVRKFSDHWAVSGSGFRAFREPSPDELYRSTQIGNELTKPNGNLLSERATGWEAGLAAQRSWGTIRASYFLTQVNRPITAFTLNLNSNPILLMRENLGQIESRGVSLDYEVAPQRWLIFNGGYQYAHAVVSRGTQDLGNWIPEVARNMATLNMSAFKPSLGTLSLQARMSGHMYDDDANDFLLHGYFRLDIYGSHAFGRRLTLFAAGENLTNRAIEVSKTPTTTLGQPIVGRAGFLVTIGGTGR
jgi:outer membrane receptor protein involved in Fe transport